MADKLLLDNSTGDYLLLDNSTVDVLFLEPAAADGSARGSLLLLGVGVSVVIMVGWWI